MFKQYIKQAFILLKSNRLLSIISIIGTALAITMIMCIVLIFRARTANYEPEVNRDRTLTLRSAMGDKIGNDGWRNMSPLSLRTIKECFYPLTTAEDVTAILTTTFLATTPGGMAEVKGTVRGTDDAFWRVFRFQFLSGKPYGEEFVSGERKAVISRSLARQIYGTDEVVGRTLSLSFIDYTICGVVKDVSILAENAYAQVWIPYTTIPGYEYSDTDGLLGRYMCCILAPDKKSIEPIRLEIEGNVARMNSGQSEYELNLIGGPDTQLMLLARENNFMDPNVVRLLVTYIVIVIILLLVPAINLSGITLSRMRQRMPEIGVRRVFGATRGELVWQVLTENFMLTLLGGGVGLLLSYISVLGMKEWLLNSPSSGYYGADTMVSAGMVFSVDVFIYAVLFCLVLNLLSAGIPAWRVSRSQIINAIKQVDK